MGEFEEKFIKPIRNASYPATLAALCLAGARLQVSGRGGVTTLFLLGAASFLVSSFSVFFYTLYPTRRTLWTVSAVAFLVGLFFLIVSVFLMLFL
ncbi:MAG TPA: hypothetical protein VMT01_00235 [Candidatus Acidoferrum sp.]|jgi:hypothetical protein|nr:hypothetical protein [Candidatus Acidoferrum sp.]